VVAGAREVDLAGVSNDVAHVTPFIAGEKSGRTLITSWPRFESLEQAAE